MNLSILGCSAVGLVAGVMALNHARDPVPVSVFQTPPAAAAPEGFLEAKLTVGKGATLGAILNEIGAPSKLTVDPAWSAFEEVGLDHDTPLGLEYDKAPVEAVLKGVNEHLEPQQRFEWRAQGQRLIFAPQAYFDRREQVLATYDIGAIVRARAAADTRSAEACSEAAQEVCHLITELVEPEKWRDNGGDLASVTRFGDKVFIKAPPRMHRQVEWVLSELPTAVTTEGFPLVEVPGQALDQQPRTVKGMPMGEAPKAASESESARVMPLQNAAAEDVAKALSGVLVAASLDGVVMAGVKIEAMPQTNSLLVVAFKDQHEVVEQLVRKMENVAAERMARRKMEIDMQNREAEASRRDDQARAKADAAASPK